MTTVDQVEQALRSRLLRGDVEPGARLRQDALAEQLGVSKIPVREALQRLAAAGLLRFEPNRGAVVPSLAASEAQEVFQLRRAVEPLLLAHSIPLLSVLHLAEAEVALSSEELALTESNWAFHRSLYVASGWQRGLALAETLHVAVAPYVMLYIESLGGAEDSEAEHRQLLEACRARDAAKAEALLVAHLARAEAALVAFLDRGPDS